jgi:hypothetical protein
MITYRVHSPGGLTDVTVIADKFEVEYGALVFYHVNEETRPMLAIAPGEWLRVTTVTP